MFNSAKDVLAYKTALKANPPVRIPQYREVIDGKMSSLDDIKSILAADYQKAFVPYQTGTPGKVLFRLTNIMASNESEIRFKARSTETPKINAVQRHEHGHEALDPLLFPITVRRKMYQFLADSYTIVALDVTPKPGVLAGYADRKKLESSVEAEHDDDTPEASYARAYQKTDAGKTDAERHDQAYDSVTSEAMIADGVGLRVRVVDPLTFEGFQTDEDPCRFNEGMEYGRKQLNPLLNALSGYGVKVEDGCLYIEQDGKRTSTARYEALGVGMIADSQSTSGSSDQYVEYTQIRTCEETIILIENVKGQLDRNGEPGILIKVPNLFGGKSTGYYLIEGDAKSRSGRLEDRYDPPLRNLLNEAQHYNIARTGWEAMALAEMTRGLYQEIENPASMAVEPHDPTQETKSAQPEDGQPIPVAEGKIARAEGFGQKIDALLQHAKEMLREAEPTDIWGGTGSSSETGIAIARRETALLTELTPYQANVATVCKYIHLDVDLYVSESGESIKLAYLPDSNESKPEIREITPESAKLAMDMDYTIGSDTPESKYASEQMSERRWQLGVIGKLDHMENIGVKDPLATEQRQIEDAIMGGVAEIVKQTATKIVSQYAEAALTRELGPAPVPQPEGPPPMAPQGPPQPNGPQPTTPVQTAPAVGGVPVAAGANAIPA